MIVELREAAGKVHIIKWPNDLPIPRLAGETVEFNDEIHIIQEARCKLVTSIPGNSGVDHVEKSSMVLFTKIK